MDKNDNDHLQIFNRLTKIETRFDGLENQVKEMRSELITIKSILLGNGKIGISGRIQRLEDSVCLIKYVAYGFGLISLSLLPLACSSVGSLLMSFFK